MDNSRYFGLLILLGLSIAGLRTYRMRGSAEGIVESLADLFVPIPAGELRRDHLTDWRWVESRPGETRTLVLHESGRCEITVADETGASAAQGSGTWSFAAGRLEYEIERSTDPGLLVRGAYTETLRGLMPRAVTDGSARTVTSFYLLYECRGRGAIGAGAVQGERRRVK